MKLSQKDNRHEQQPLWMAMLPLERSEKCVWLDTNSKQLHRINNLMNYGV